jgi:hypothetical protein
MAGKAFISLARHYAHINEETLMKKMIALGALLMLSGCCGLQRTPTENPTVANNPAQQICPEQRPQMCTKQYAPVCATRDTGIRCVKAPCPSTEERTYGNGCTACADEKVMGFIPGECPGVEKQD